MCNFLWRFCHKRPFIYTRGLHDTEEKKKNKLYYYFLINPKCLYKSLTHHSFIHTEISRLALILYLSALIKKREKYNNLCKLLQKESSFFITFKNVFSEEWWNRKYLCIKDNFLFQNSNDGHKFIIRNGRIQGWKRKKKRK